MPGQPHKDMSRKDKSDVLQHARETGQMLRGHKFSAVAQIVVAHLELRAEVIMDRSARRYERLQWCLAAGGAAPPSRSH